MSSMRVALTRSEHSLTLEALSRRSTPFFVLGRCQQGPNRIAGAFLCRCFSWRFLPIHVGTNPPLKVVSGLYHPKKPTKPRHATPEFCDYSKTASRQNTKTLRSQYDREGTPQSSTALIVTSIRAIAPLFLKTSVDASTDNVLPATACD